MLERLDTWLTEWYAGVGDLRRPREGQGLVEYAVIVAVVAVMLIAALVALRGQISNVFASIQQKLAQNTQ